MGLEQTLILIKPDGVRRRLIGRIVSRFEEKGFRIIAMKMLNLERKQAETHYNVHRSKPFFEDLVRYITSGPIVAMILEGNNAISVTRLMCGSTDGSKAQPGTIRGDFSQSIEKNIIHASDSPESYQHEVKIFFSPEEIMNFQYGDEHHIF
ncbi:nucleoside-diphosphate kinase [Thermoplasmatales archaeon AK]|nr:nucleoside-diphosphate kinase [Thermoplasmatales archaeon AK]